MADLIKKMEDKILSEELLHDERVIEKEREKMNKHEVQEDDDKCKLIKDLHAEEIKHDEKEIERKEKDAQKHEEKIKENEKAIHDVK